MSDAFPVNRPATPGSQNRRQRLVAVGAVALLAVAGAGGWWVSRDEPAEPAAPTTTRVPVTQAVPVAATNVWATTVATGRVPEIAVFEQQPAEAELDEAEVERRRASDAAYATFGPPHSTNSPIPTLEEPVVGRFRTETGWTFSNPTETGQPRVFRVVEDHGDWLKVQLPVRPNDTEGWIKASDVELSTTTYHVRISLTERKLTLRDGDAVLMEHSVGIGKDSTPTPTGRLYLTDKIEKYEGSAFGKWILQLSGFSTALDEFSGGAPVLAIHGTRNPDNAGQKVSNGCIRVPGDTISELAAILPHGTPVDIVA